MDYNKSLIKRRRIRIGDISISYLLKDAEPADQTVVFVHGFPFNKNMWIPQLAALPPSTRGIAMDVRGHGNSTTGQGSFGIPEENGDRADRIVRDFHGRLHCTPRLPVAARNVHRTGVVRHELAGRRQCGKTETV